MKRVHLFVALVVATMFAACGEDPIDQPSLPNQPEGLSFDVNILATTRTTMTFSVTPSDEEAEYFCYVVDRATVEDSTADKYLIANILQRVGEEASSVGQTLEEYMATATDRGVVEEGRFSGLTMNTEYYLLVFGVDAERGYTANSDLSKTLFVTSSVEASECTFEVQTAVENNAVTFDVEPSDKEIYWYLFTVTADQYRYYVEAEDGPAMTKGYFYEYYFQQEINAYRQQGYGDAEIIEAIIHQGSLQLEAKGLKANTEYCYLIAGMTIDNEGVTITTDVFMGSYTTGDAAKSSMTFEIEVWDIEQMAASFSITPSNNTDKYCALVQPWDGVSTADEVMHQIVDQWGGWMDIMSNDRGKVEHSGSSKFKLPAADTDYYIIAFGYEGGITTDAAMVTFRTLPGGSVEDVSFSISCSNVTPYDFMMNITSSDPTIYYVPGACVKDSYDEAEYVAMEEDTFDYFYAGSKDFNPSITVAEVLDQYYYNGDTQVQVSGVLPDMEFMGYIYALDVHTGKVVKCFTFDRIAHTESLGDVLPTIELVGYYSGKEEAGSIFGDATATADKAITVVKYGDLDDVRTLFTTMVEGDCTNTVGYPDNDVWSLALGYWKTCKLSQPYTFYLVDWNVEQTALAYAVDNAGKMGGISRLYTLPTAQDKSPITELAELVDRLNAEAEALTPPSSLVIDESATPKKRATITPVE